MGRTSRRRAELTDDALARLRQARSRVEQVVADLQPPDPAPAPPPTAMWRPWHHQAWSIVNASSAPIWLLMILAPRAGVTATATAAAPALQVGLGLTYAGLLGRGVATGTERADFRDGESMARALANPPAMLAGWTHYIAFDLFVGVWIHRVGLEEGISTRVALLLTWMTGPAGLTLFSLQRALARRRTGSTGGSTVADSGTEELAEDRSSPL